MPLDTILSLFHPSRIFTSHIPKIHLNIILPSTRPSSWPLFKWPDFTAEAWYAFVTPIQAKCPVSLCYCPNNNVACINYKVTPFSHLLTDILIKMLLR